MLTNVVLLTQTSKQQNQTLNTDLFYSQIHALNHCVIVAISGWETKTIVMTFVNHLSVLSTRNYPRKRGSLSVAIPK